MTTLPTLFLSHGSPMIALEPRAAGAFMQRLGSAINATFGQPKAILVVSAHSLAREPLLFAAARHEAVYDFGGFDPQLNTLRYDAPGAPALAERAAALIQAAGLPAHVVNRSGLDHGIWTPLRYLFPDAQIPVLPLAWPPDWAPAKLLALGAALAPLADEGVLILGSGSLTHNLRLVFAGRASDPTAVDAPEIAETAAFRAWVHSRAQAGDVAALLDYRKRAPHAELMHPSDEHWLPWYPAQGAGGAVGTRLHESMTFGTLAMDSYAFGPQAPRLAAALQEP